MPMFEFNGLEDMKGWMREPALSPTEVDPSEATGSVVISSRVRLSRNLSSSPYPGRSTADQETECRERIMGAMRDLPNGSDFTIIHMDDVTALERRILFERNIISQGYSIEKNRALALSADESVAAIVGDEDHLRLVGMRCGTCLGALLERLDVLDTQLEGVLPYAVSTEWGYLNTAVTNLGTGLKASLMLHLPALTMSGLIKRAVKASAQLGLSIRGFFSESMESLGDMYIIANEITIGLSEKEIITNLGRIAIQLAGYENKTREELMEKRRVDIEDRVYRAWGLLSWCRYITHREAIEALSALRMGVSLGLIANVDASTITALLFLSQKSHIQRVLQSSADAVDSKLIDYTRAKIIREALTQAREG
jgi:protein arginine kinase